MVDISTKLTRSKDEHPPVLWPDRLDGERAQVGAASLRISTGAASAFADPTQNTFLSAASLQIALAMLADGAHAGMARELADFYAEPGTVPGTAALKGVIAQVQKAVATNGVHERGDTRLGAAYFVASGQQSKGLDLPKIQALAAGIGAYVKQGSAPELNKAASKWAKRVSAGLIPDLPLQIHPSMILTLAGSSFASGNWAGIGPSFPSMEFTSAEGKTSMVEGLDFGSESVWIFRAARGYVAIPRSYGPEFQLYLPDEGIDPASLSEADWDYDVENPLFGTAKFPQLKLRTSYNLLADGAAIGMPDVGSAAFLGFSADGAPLQVAAMAQESALVVDENGYAAASITAIALARMAAPAPTDPIHLVFDRPFALRIYDEDTQWTLFYGVINDAAAASLD